MMKMNETIQHNTLSAVVWNQENKLRPTIKDFIFSCVAGFSETEELKGYDDYTTDMFIGATLASYNYTMDSKLYVKVVIDPILFTTHNPQFSMQSSEDILTVLQEMAKKSTLMTAYVPSTQHQLSIYFMSVKEASPININKYDSVYSLFFDKWVKKPKKDSVIVLLDSIRHRAKAFLEELDTNNFNSERDAMDFIIFKEELTVLPTIDMITLKNDLEVSLNRINTVIEQIVLAKLINPFVGASVDNKMFNDIAETRKSPVALKNDLLKRITYLKSPDDSLLSKLIYRYGYSLLLLVVDKVLSKRPVEPTQSFVS